MAVEVEIGALHLYTKEHQDLRNVVEAGRQRRDNHQNPPKDHGPDP